MVVYAGVHRMIKNTLLVVAMGLAGTLLFGAAYRADMSGSGSATPGTVAAALKPVESALVNGQYNRALMLVRNVASQTAAVAMPVGASAPDPTPTPTPSPAPVTPDPVTPAPVTPPSPAADAAPIAPTPTDVASVVLAYQAYPGALQEGKSLFDRLKIEIDTRLVPPFNTIDNVWDSNPADCVAQYTAHIDLCKQWVAHYQQLFASTDWQPLGNYFYDKILKNTAYIGTSVLFLNPLKVTVMGSGIHGTAYAAVYDNACNVLEALKSIKVRQVEIDALKTLVSGAKTRSSIQGGLF